MRPCLIEKKFSGPVALWQLMDAGEIKSADGRHVVKLRINHCPGPSQTPHGTGILNELREFLR